MLPGGLGAALAAGYCVAVPVPVPVPPAPPQGGLGQALDERYLDLLKGCLTRYLFLDEEVQDVAPAGWKGAVLAPVRRALGRRGVRVVRTGSDREARRLGRTWPATAETMVGMRRLDHVQACVAEVVREGIPGDLIETGVWRGGTTILMRAVLAAHGDVTRRVWVADSFRGLPRPDVSRYPADAVDPFQDVLAALSDGTGDSFPPAPSGPGTVSGMGPAPVTGPGGPGVPAATRAGLGAATKGLAAATRSVATMVGARSRRSGDGHPWSTPMSVLGSLVVSLDEVKANFARYGLLDDQVQFLPGWFRDTLPDAPIDRLAVVRLDGDLYESTMDALVALYPKLSVGGWLIVDDYRCIRACRQAVTDYRAAHGIAEAIEEVDWSAVCWKRLR